ncbi:UDP-N-acetylmuramoyl-L-alanine--D-glutamate ligase [Colwellia sp. E2M01]|uniref:UDP-N-acetylmuramoyl-L-alanine--D-glutamate ligase n=1 Tax=Colwellia sp. E2M01 TaxID=2841561 RepID=UPI001C087C0E|nr:UDP-N-acetylmuramoyl-L-alanine--D-glutamate ligase [Colwellia sp. E2M01]MBU2870221.1 UDP-N-acetylmuramoyl-L-alanine--D-glutamate ligase [Colwellia sp. E2M01]
MTWLTAFKDKKIVVLGAGMTGLSCLRFLHAQNLSIAVNDSRVMPFSSEAELAQYQIDFPHATFIFGQWDQALIANADIIVASPGIDLDKEGITTLINNNCQLIGDIELFCLVNNRLPTPMQMLAVTGSNGKSTVVSLLAHLAKKLGVNAVLVGNIGEPILDLLVTTNSAEQPELVIVELSSFQLETLTSMKAIAASVLNLSDDHLDRHKTLAVYQALKQGIYPQAQIAVISREDKATQSLVAQQSTISFGLSKPESGHFGLALISINEAEEAKQTLMFGEQALIALDELPLAGMHNALNYMAALALGYTAGWSLSAMTNNLAGFTGLAHRCQRVSSEDGIQWINDSKATNVGATLAAISGLAPTLNQQNKLILIAGGDGKGADFAPLVPVLNSQVSQLITLGKDGSEIAALANTTNKAIEVNTLAEAIEQANKIANRGDMVLLSPACASIDMFKNYMVRGEQFIASVTQLQVASNVNEKANVKKDTKEAACR